jgi:hypothetical protein
MMDDMAGLGRMHGRAVLWSALASTILGCSGSSPASDDAGAISEETLSCAAPSCCVPVDIDSYQIIVYQSGGEIGIMIGLDVPVPSSDAWSASVDVALSWGVSISCTATIASKPSNFVTLVCPTVRLDYTPACDSALTLELRPRTSTYADTAGTQVVCAGQQGAPLRFAATVACPTCPSLSESSNFQPCDFPYMTCFYGATASNGTSGSLPCECIPNDACGHSSWSCAVY